MLYTVQIRLDGGNFAADMAEMREWLDRQKLEPDVFRYRMFAERVLVRVDFKTSADAAAFAEAFAGSVAGLE